MASELEFKIVIVYEDFAATVRAKEFAMQLADQRKTECKINSWKFDFLRHSMLCQQAVAQASVADLVIISADGGADLPAHINTWLESWLRQRQDGLAVFVALLDQNGETSDEPSRLGAYLRQMAAKWSVDLCCKGNGWRRPELSGPFEATQRRPKFIPPVLEEVLHGDSAYREWGLND